jgi:hypothetical protein
MVAVGEVGVVQSPERAAADESPHRIDYTGAVYGWLLAASVVAGTGPRHGGAPPGELAALLVGTGLVFWMAHSYARLVGARLHWTRLTWHEVRVVARHEWPLAGAAFPAAAVAVFGLLTCMPDPYDSLVLSRRRGGGPGRLGGRRSRRGRRQPPAHRLVGRGEPPDGPADRRHEGGIRPLRSVAVRGAG